MNFLNSAILVGLIAAVAPLIIHLLNRQKVRTIEFSSLMFLRNFQKTKMRRLKLRQLLLLILRTLIVVFAVLAFARPTIKSGAFSTIGAHAKTSAVFLTDQSASMQARTPDGSAAERAARRAAQVIGLLKEGDQAVRGEFTSNAMFGPATSDFTGLADALREQTPAAGSTDLLEAISHAEKILAESKNLNREIYVFSDLARNGFNRSPALSIPNMEHPARIYLVDVHDSRAINAAVTAVKFSGELIEPGAPFEIIATIVNRTSETFDHLLVGAFLDGRRVAQDDVALQPGAATEVRFRLEADTPGLHRGYVELADDDNLADNRCFFAFRIPQSVDVLLVSDFPSERSFIRRALTPGGVGRLTVTERDTRELALENLVEYDAVMLAAARRFEPVVLENLDRYLRSGGGVLLLPAADVDTTVYNSGLLRRYFGLEFVQAPDEFPTGDRFFILQDIDWQHPIMAIYRDVPQDKIPEIRFYSAFGLDGEQGRPAIMRFSDGRPALIESGVGRGKILLWTAPLDPNYSDISYHSLFVPLVGRSAEYLAADLGEQAVDYRIGQSVSRPRSAFWRGPLVLEFPDGRAERLAPELAPQPDLYVTPDLTVPGTYTVRDGDEQVDIFAVNVDEVETEVQPTDPAEIESRLPGRSLAILGPNDDLSSVVLSSRYGREIWKILLWIVVGLLFLETLLARTKKSDLPPDMRE